MTNNPCDNCPARKAYDAEVAKEALKRLERIKKVGEQDGNGRDNKNYASGKDDSGTSC